MKTCHLLDGASDRSDGSHCSCGMVTKKSCPEVSPMSILGDVPTACEDSSSQQDGDGC